jgi:hypothetical protein
MFHKETAAGHKRRLLRKVVPMKYREFTNDSLTMMYEGVRGALASDDALGDLGQEPRFRVRETPEWKKHAADLESGMLKRGIIFEVIDWSADRPSPPLEP